MIAGAFAALLGIAALVETYRSKWRDPVGLYLVGILYSWGIIALGMFVLAYEGWHHTWIPN